MRLRCLRCTSSNIRASGTSALRRDYSRPVPTDHLRQQQRSLQTITAGSEARRSAVRA
ncbi:hypothetical protein T4E_10571 [Trichinella pseudospiralis]|uniref:Uncharacterized protein n=1 Tax=Trichinella pseudospiralis TaxID=6337 RepID=A0A0V0WL50_TRIPS|nr:hypothetical protein T4E_10571 [Trichinella pseudospiralis]